MFSSAFHEVVQGIYEAESADYWPDEAEEEEMQLVLSCGTALILSEPEYELIEIRAPLVMPPTEGVSKLLSLASVHMPSHDVEIIDVDDTLAVAGIRLDMRIMSPELGVNVGLTFRNFVETCWQGELSADG
ncbi:hypothetical protein FP568_04490 [Pandoraea pnomenusa]|uniref:hypothetical protein n=1 Tax=Pandoraea pnomenusa TaxID=93220 RepID=UPI0011986C72|nr:hypothetical protein [Pandoraea pnomenusa]QDX20587.1 hypothetical protein FP568_04490 [Pandoraea pnomenusa]